MSRGERKLDHIRYALELPDGPASSGFEDVTPVHCCLPDASSAEVVLAGTCATLSLVHPIIINAMTGGAPELTEWNRQLAQTAAASGSAIAVGSQMAALEDTTAIESFRVVRRENPAGIVFANIGAYATVDMALRTVDMLEAQALQIHLNAVQEAFMPEGDRDYRGWLGRVEQISRACPVPVIAKETGCGMAKEQVQALFDAGVSAVDVGGAGGANFLKIEASRVGRELSDETAAYGIPTVASLFEAMAVYPAAGSRIVSGGVRSGLDICKSLAIGADAVGIATPILRAVQQGGVDGGAAYIEGLLQTLRTATALLGAQTIAQLRNVPLVVTGQTAAWLAARGIDTDRYARREGQRR